MGKVLNISHRCYFCRLEILSTKVGSKVIETIPGEYARAHLDCIKLADAQRKAGF